MRTDKAMLRNFGSIMLCVLASGTLLGHPPGYEPSTPGRPIPWKAWHSTRAGSDPETADWVFRPPVGEITPGSSPLPTQVVFSPSARSLRFKGRNLRVPDQDPAPRVRLFSAELDGDGREDYLLLYEHWGTGLAATGRTATLILSGRQRPRTYSHYGYGLEPGDFIRTDSDETLWILCDLVTVPPGEKDITDRRGHSFWVYRAFRITRSALTETQTVRGFPAWIQYTERENHTESPLIHPSGKRRRLKTLKGLD